MNKPNNAIIRLFLKFGIVILFLASLTGSTFFILSYEKASWMVNRFASDGNIESFNRTFFETSRIPFLIFFVILMVISILAAVRFEITLQYLMRIVQTKKNDWGFFKQSWKRLCQDFFHYFDRKSFLTISIISLFALLIRLVLIHKPMGHDESYTSVIFAFEPLYNGLSDYHFPNNHVFHTLLVHIAYKIFGPQEWAVRLPALISGVLLVPGGYILAKTWYGSKVAVVTAVLIASFPELIQYSVNARGYSVMALFTLLLLISVNYARLYKNSAAWFLAGIFGAFGFYTLPIMAYPLLIVYTWLGLSWIFGDYTRDYSKINFFFSIFCTGIFTVGLSLALYIPVFKNWGIKSLLANEYTQALGMQAFTETLLSRLLDTWRMLDQGVIPLIGGLILVGFVLSFLLFKRIGKIRIPIQITSLLVISFLVAIQRPNIYYRTWIFYIPFLIMWCVAGWMSVGRLQTIISKLPGKPTIATIVGFLIAIIFSVNGVFYVMKLAPSAKNGTGDVEQATLFIHEQLGENDIVVITATNDARMWFYFEKYGLGRDHFSRVIPFENAFVVVSNTDNQTIPFVISERGPDKGFFAMETTKKLKTINSLDIYLIQANAEAVSKAYGDWE